MFIETVDPGAEGIRKAVEDYVERYPEYAQALLMYGAIMEAQQETLSRIGCPVELSEEEIEEKLTAGEPLVDRCELEIDPVIFRDLFNRICGIVDETKPGEFPHCPELATWEGLSDEQLSSSRNLVLRGEALSVAATWENENEKIIASSIFWETLAPFYRRCGSILYRKMGSSPWLWGFCPVCGSAPLIGKFRGEDGLWLVECSLCHTLWNLQRAMCPFCDRSAGHLEYLYLEDEPGRRVQYCESCKTYLKTVDVRDGQREVLLPLEDIVTSELDAAALDEGLTAARHL
jgi:FdhE protein